MCEKVDHRGQTQLHNKPAALHSKANNILSSLPINYQHSYWL